MLRDFLLWGERVAGTRALQTYGSMTKDSNPEKQICPLLSSVLAWELEAESEPSTHFSNLSTSLCLHYHSFFFFFFFTTTLISHLEHTVAS